MPSFHLNPRTLDVLDRLPDRSGPRIKRIWGADGYTIIYTGLLASRLKIYKDHDNLFRVSRHYCGKNGTTFIDIETPVQELAEKWLISRAGVNHRWLCSMRPLLLPRRTDELKHGYQIITHPDTSHSLTRNNDTLIPAKIFNHGFTTLNSVRFSYIADIPLDQLVDSYLNPKGTPLASTFPPNTEE